MAEKYVSKKKPNIVLIMSDQQRGDCLSIDGHPHLMTPVLDNLAYDGVRFRHAYSESPTCIPARRCLMTGQTPATNGVTGFALGVRIQTELTLPELFRRNGYQTASIGRGMHQSPAHARYGFEIVNEQPTDEIYSEFHSIQRVPHRGHMMGWPHSIGGITSNGFRTRPWPYEERFHETNWSTAKAMEFITRRDKDVPFFLYVGFVAPHPPLLPPAHYYERYMRMTLNGPSVGDWASSTAVETGKGVNIDPREVKLTGNFNQECRAGYYGLINHLDDQLSMLLERIRCENEETYIIFTSDHGEMLGDHNFFCKGLPFEGSAHIPMIVHGPGLPKGKIVDDAVCLMDILPTCCTLAGIDIPQEVEGKYLLTFAAPGDDGIREYIHGEHSFGVYSNHYLTDGKQKYIWFTQTGREHFFDLENDPRETHDCISDDVFKSCVDTWRARMILELTGRDEGFTDGKCLIAGRPYPDRIQSKIEKQ